MPRISGINVPDNKQIWIALTYIFGIGPSLSKEILNEAGVDHLKKAADLNADEINRLREIIEKKHKTEGELKRSLMTNIKRLRDIGSWRGIRHAKGLPARGQTTRTNSRTVRGNVRKTVGSGRKPPPAPR
jgi:small subunit ribosomal protein S13